MVKSRYGNTQVQRRTDGGGRGCRPKGAYKEVPRPSRRLGLATTKSSLTLESGKSGNVVFFARFDLVILASGIA